MNTGSAIDGERLPPSQPPPAERIRVAGVRPAPSCECPDFCPLDHGN